MQRHRTRLCQSSILCQWSRIHSDTVKMIIINTIVTLTMNLTEIDTVTLRVNTA